LHIRRCGYAGVFPQAQWFRVRFCHLRRHKRGQSPIFSNVAKACIEPAFSKAASAEQRQGLLSVPADLRRYSLRGLGVQFFLLTNKSVPGVDLAVSRLQCSKPIFFSVCPREAASLF
jgi:hypothetical protein